MIVNIGKSINIACGKYGKLKKDLAAFLKVSIQTISNWSKGHTEPNQFQIEMMAAFFGLKASEFIALGESK